MNRKFKIIKICGLILLILNLSVSAQFFKGKREVDVKKYFQIDHALFESEDGTGFRLEVYYQIFNTALNFIEEDNEYTAEFDVLIRLFDKKGHLLDSALVTQKAVLTNSSKINSVIDFRTNQVNFIVDKGKYEVKIYLKDRDNKKTLERKFKFKTWSLDRKRPKLSSIELIQAVVASKEKKSVFDKGTLSMVPSVTHVYGNVENQKIYFYLEIYRGLDTNEKARIEISLRHYAKGLQYRDSMTIALDDPINRQFRELNVDSLRPGKYELIVTLKGKRDKKIDVRYADFEINWSAKAMLVHNYDMIIRQLELATDNIDLKELRNKKTFQDRLDAFNKFWLERDPTPGTAENELKSMFYQRVYIANENFSYFERNGWKTDRGRIYIIFGEPDQLDDYPIVPNSRPYQEWHYYRGDKYRMFVFVDENEDGDYRLVYPDNGLFIRPEN